MYVTETQLQQILQNPYFSNLATQSVVNYVLYRGHLNATVHTLRFNNTNRLNNTNLLQQIATYLFSQWLLYYGSQNRIPGHYGFVAVHSAQHNPLLCGLLYILHMSYFVYSG
jgi:hypothetical protein